LLTYVKGDFGPFDPDVDVDVPLWLAITLRKKINARFLFLNGFLLVGNPTEFNTEY